MTLGSRSKVALIRTRGAVAVIWRDTGFSVAERRAAAGPVWITTDSVVPNSQLGQDWSGPGPPRYTACWSNRTQVCGCSASSMTGQDAGTSKV